jgi:hypothetical protein
VAQLYPQALGSLFFTSYDLQGYTSLWSERPFISISVSREITGGAKNLFAWKHISFPYPFVKNEILRIAERYKAQTANHDNKLIEEPYTNGPVTRRLNRTWLQYIIYQ